MPHRVLGPIPAGLYAFGPVSFFEGVWRRRTDAGGTQGIYVTPLTARGREIAEAICLARRQNCPVEVLADGTVRITTQVKSTADLIYANIRAYRQQEGQEGDYNVDMSPILCDATRCMDATRGVGIDRVSDILAAQLGNGFRVELDVTEQGEVQGVYFLKEGVNSPKVKSADGEVRDLASYTAQELLGLASTRMDRA